MADAHRKTYEEIAADIVVAVINAGKMSSYDADKVGKYFDTVYNHVWRSATGADPED